MAVDKSVFDILDLVPTPKGWNQYKELGEKYYRSFWRNPIRRDSMRNHLESELLVSSTERLLKNHFKSLFSQNNNGNLSKEGYKKLASKIINESPESDDLYIDSTSGSTGFPISVVRPAKSLVLEYLRLRSVLTYFGVQTSDLLDKIGIVYLSHYPNSKSYIFFDPVMETYIVKLNIVEFKFFNKIEKVSEYLANNFVLSGTPTSLMLLDSKIKFADKTPSICLISGESCPIALEAFITDKFKCDLFRTYTIREIGLIGFQCKFDNTKYHLCDEVIQAEEFEGEILFSDYSNDILPIHNYRCYDRGRLYRNIECTCGLQTTVLKELNGRDQHFFQTTKGQSVDIGVVTKLLEAQNILWYNVRMLETNRVEVSYYSKEAVVDIGAITNSIHSIFDARDLEISFVSLAESNLTKKMGVFKGMRR